MPASHEQIPNKPLSGSELVEIIEKLVHKTLTKDGMFSQNIAFRRVSAEVRVSLHMDNPVYPEHVATALTQRASIQEIEANPQLAALEAPPLKLPLSGEETVFSEETHIEIASPNMARISNDMPIIQERRNLDTNQIDRKEVRYTGDLPDPATVGNTSTTTGTSVDQRQKWDRLKRVGKK